jgi:uncharacterized alkaline shock family protein YloU
MVEPGTEPTQGRVKVANEVIAQIAALTALQVEGVAGVADRTNGLARVIRRGSGLHKGVRVDFTDDQSLRLKLFLVADSGRRLPELAAEIQRRVVAAVDRMVGLRAETVDVLFSDVRFSDTPA